MASIKMISEEKATGKVKEIYEEIKSNLGIAYNGQGLGKGIFFTGVAIRSQSIRN